jgi:hypothetical protein
MRKAAVNLGVSGGVGGKLAYKRRCEAAANLGVSGGVGCKLAYKRRCARR